MKKIIYFLLVIAASASCRSTALAQDGRFLNEDEQKQVGQLLGTVQPADTAWKFGGTLSLNFTQTYLNNWAAGGQNAISISALTSLFSNYTKGIHSWENNLELAYGMLRQGENDFIKTDDRFSLSSKYGRKASKSWYYSALLTVRSQFTPGYNVEDGKELRDQGKTSDFFSPGYLIGSIGMDYKPNENFSLLISPVTLKTTVVLDDSLVTDYGLDADQNFRNEFGGFIKLQYKTDLVENVTYTTKADFFSNYLDNPQNIDVNWENLIAMKINKFLSVTISVQVIYDDDIIIGATDAIVEDGVVVEPAHSGGPRTQLKEVVALGLSYKF